MFSDLINELINAKSDNETERAYKRLEKIGVDRVTADVLVKELKDTNDRRNVK